MVEHNIAKLLHKLTVIPSIPKTANNKIHCLYEYNSSAGCMHLKMNALEYLKSYIIINQTTGGSLLMKQSSLGMLHYRIAKNS